MPVPTPPTTPSTPPLAPQRTEPTTFSARMDAWLAWFNSSFWVWVYDLVPWIQARANETEAWSNTASASAAAAGVSQTVAAEATATATAAITTVTQQAQAAAANSATISSVAAAASASASAASASSVAAASYRDQALAAWSASTAPAEQLAAQSASLHYGAVVKALVYDTSKDSDGGAWRKRCNDKSWYNETLGGTSWIGQRSSEAVARAYVGSLANPNLVTNGTFTTDTSGWTALNSATFAQSAAAAVLTIAAAQTYGAAYQAITCIVGKNYFIDITITQGTAANATLRISNSTANAGDLVNSQTSSSGRLTASFTATQTTHYIGLFNGGAATQTTTFDNISVKLVDSAIDPANTVYQSTADGKFYKLNTTSGTTEVRRGISRPFPAIAGIVAEAMRVVIYDLTQSGAPMWMVFVGGDVVLNGLLSFDQSTGSPANYLSSMAALNGTLFASQSNGGNGQGLRIINFITDTADRVGDSSRLNTWRFKGNISRRNNADGGYQYSSVGLVNLTANDVAVVALDSAPIDPATGLPVPTIAVATAGGVSVIKDDGTVASLTLTSNSATSVSIVGDRFTYSISNSGRYLAEYSLRAMTSHTIATLDATDSQRLAMYAPTTALSIPTVSAGGPTGALVTCANSTVAVGGPSALNLLRRNPTTQAAGMVSYITNAYNSGWQIGDSRLAALADTTAETVTASGELVTNGTFTTDTSGWTTGNSATFVMSGAAGLLTNGAALNGYAYQAITTVVGKTYTITADFTKGTSVGGNLNIGTSVTGIQLGQHARTTTGVATVTFTATTTTTYVSLVNASAVSAETSTFDNISVKLADADRSVKNKGLVVNGTLTKAAVASGANLVAYSGMNTSNYLEQPFSTDLDFSTGDFCYMGWVYNAGTDHSIIHRGPLGSITGNGVVDIWTYETASQIKAAFAGVQLTLSATSNSNHFVAYVRTGGVLYGYVNGVLAGSIANTNSMTLGTSDSLYIGKGYYSTGLAGGVADRLALWRISATAPSADQIAHIYRTELPLFQAGAQCTLAGSTTAVTGMSYDDATNLLSVSTAGTTSRFKDLLRVSSDTSTAGTATSVSAVKGMEIVGGSTGASIYTPAVLLRDELNKSTSGPATPQPYRQFSVKDQQVFQSQVGVKVVGVYVRGILKERDVDYTMTSDGFRYIITTVDKQASRTEVTLLQIKE